MFDVAIIGAGVIGSMTARELSRYDLSVCVLERANDAAAGASRANSGIVHAGFDAKPGTLKAKLNVRGSEMMEEVTQQLGVKYIRNGSLVIGFDDHDRETVEELYQRGQENGVRELEILNGESLRALEPNVSPKAVCALYAPTGAIVCPYELTIAALGNAMDNGAAFYREFEVTAIDGGDVWCLHSADGRTVEARYVVNAAGVYGDEIGAMLGDTATAIMPAKGEYLLLDQECGNLVSHTIFRTPTEKGKGILVSPTVDGNLLLGPTSDKQESREDTGTTAEGISSVIGQALGDVEGIPMGKVITSFAGLRAAGNTGDFIIRPWSGRGVEAVGIESPGLTASPAIAEYIAELLQEQGLKLAAKSDFHPCRRAYHWYKELPLAEKDAYIKEHPAYGKIVCRCETVSEGEILEAIRREPKAMDLDGVKRRTRSGMGRCQGGFCSPRIVELLAKEHHIPVWQVTKSGGKSYINIGKTKGGEAL